MIGDRLRELRKRKDYSMEYVAEKVDVSRQTIAKWENGESLPDILKCRELAALYDVSLDILVLEDDEAPDEKRTGKYIFGVVKVGERGQIVLPQKARKIFHIEAGDQLLVLGDTAQGGLAVVKTDVINDWME